MSEQEQNFGPAMGELTDLQRAWVYALVEKGGNGTEAAMIAGYGANAATAALRDGACRVASHSNSRNPKIQAAIREEAGHRLYTGALIGASVLMEIAGDVFHKDRLKAAKLLLEHNGYQIIAEQNINVNHTSTDTKAVIARIVDMAGRLGLDPQALLGRYGVVVDAEFKVIEDKSAPASAAGLEDLL